MASSKNATPAVSEVPVEEKETESGLSLTDEQWAEVFKHPRFSNLNERAKKAEAELAKLKKQFEKEQEEKLKEENKYQELYEAEKQKNQQLAEQMTEVSLNSEITRIANGLKVVDTEAVIKLIDRTKIEKDDSGQVRNLEKVVADLVESKPYLLGNTNSNIGSGANTDTTSQNGNFVITRTELAEKVKDLNWYSEHKNEVAQWQKEGRVDLTK